MKGCSAFPKAPALLKVTNQLFHVISGHSLGSLTPLQRCCRCILQPLPTLPGLWSSYYYYYHTSCELIVFHWSPSGSKFPQVSRTLLSILIDLNNAVIWMVSIRPLISNSFRTLTKPMGTVPSAPITIGTTVTLMFHSFYNC